MDSKEWLAQLTPFVAAFVAGVASVWAAMNQAKKNRSDAVTQANESIMRLIDHLQKTVDGQAEELLVLRERVRKLEDEKRNYESYIDFLTDGIERLTAQVEEAGLTPAFDAERGRI